MAGRTTHRLTVMIALGAALAACAQAPAPPGRSTAAGERQCFRAADVNSFGSVDRDTVNVRVGTRAVYQLDLLGTCPEVDWATQVGVRSTSGSSWICRGLDAEIVVPGPGGVQRCPILGIRQLTAEEVEQQQERR